MRTLSATMLQVLRNLRDGNHVAHDLRARVRPKVGMTITALRARGLIQGYSYACSPTPAGLTLLTRYEDESA